MYMYVYMCTCMYMYMYVYLHSGDSGQYTAYIHVHAATRLCSTLILFIHISHEEGSKILNGTSVAMGPW